MRIIKHCKGGHVSSPFIFDVALKAKTIVKEFSFTDSCKYVIPNEDQNDWNKLTGVSFNLIDARQDTIMCGWRYNVEKDEFELCGYYHINGSFNPPQYCLVTVKAQERFTVVFAFNKGMKTAAISFIIKGKTNITEMTPFNKFGINRIVNTWFGGTTAAPNDMEIIEY